MQNFIAIRPEVRRPFQKTHGDHIDPPLRGRGLTRAREGGGADFALPLCFSEITKKTYGLILTSLSVPDQK